MPRGPVSTSPEDPSWAVGKCQDEAPTLPKPTSPLDGFRTVLSLQPIPKYLRDGTLSTTHPSICAFVHLICQALCWILEILLPVSLFSLVSFPSREKKQEPRGLSRKLSSCRLGDGDCPVLWKKILGDKSVGFFEVLGMEPPLPITLPLTTTFLYFFFHSTYPGHVLHVFDFSFIVSLHPPKCYIHVGIFFHSL